MPAGCFVEKRHVGETRDDALKGDTGLKPGQRLARTFVAAVPEGQMTVWGAPYVEPVWIRKLRLVPICRPHDHTRLLSFRRTVV